MVRALAALLACAACQGQPAGVGAGGGSGSGAEPGAGTSAAASRDAEALDADPAAGDAGSGAVATGEPRTRVPIDEPDVPDPGRVIAELGAIPAWQAVIDRAQLLGRRGQHGVVYGRVGPVVMVPAPVAPPATPGVGSASPPGAGSGAAAGSGSAASSAGTGSAVGPGAALGGGGAARPGAVVRAVVAGRPALPVAAAAEPALVASPYVWLIDDTDGNGALGIRILLGGKANQGDRIAAGGAWQLDAERRWFWKPDAIQPLPPAPPGDVKDPPPAAPSHAIATGALPVGARTASLARDNDAIYFQIAGPSPASEGDGWQIADQLGSPVALVLNLPGERATYGGQDMRAADERWQLRRGQTYWVRIGRLHKHTNRPTQVNARTAPVRVL